MSFLQMSIENARRLSRGVSPAEPMSGVSVQALPGGAIPVVREFPSVEVEALREGIYLQPNGDPYPHITQVGKVLFVPGGPYYERMRRDGYLRALTPVIDPAVLYAQEQAKLEALKQSQLLGDVGPDEDQIPPFDEKDRPDFWTFYQDSGVKYVIAERLWAAGYQTKEALKASFLKDGFDKLESVQGVGRKTASKLLIWAGELPEFIMSQSLADEGNEEEN